MAQVEVRFYTQQYRPDHKVTIRGEQVDNWQSHLAGTYQLGYWRFFLSSANLLTFKFVLDHERWQGGDNIQATPPPPGGALSFGDGFEGVWFQDEELPVPESGAVARSFFAPDLNEEREYDIIVVGSGVGGGTLAEELSDRGLTTLVLEAGSYLFPTHIANISRAHKTGEFDKHVWGLFPRFQTRPYNSLPGSVYNGAQGYNLGGRSVFWGGFTPRMRPYEFEPEFWPSEIRDELLDDDNPYTSYYKKAETLMKVGPPRPSKYQDLCKKWLRDQLGGDFIVFDAPMAIQRQTTEERNISAGLFSTADLLMESRGTNGPAGNQNLIVNLNHDVRRVTTDGSRATGVEAYDRINQQTRFYRAKNVVLSAGALESPKIAQKSELTSHTSWLIGRGLTDHQIWFVHFAIPQDSALYSNEASSKIVIQHKDPTPTNHGWNCILELGADFNQGRYLDEDIRNEHVAKKNGNMLCELVFLTSAPLEEDNFITAGQSEDGRPMDVYVGKSNRASSMYNEMTTVKNQIIHNLKGFALRPEESELQLLEAGVGGVSHEVGTMRISNDPTKGVVDSNLKVHGYQNLFCCDLSVFPTSPSANPTLALGALALRLADLFRRE